MVGVGEIGVVESPANFFAQHLHVLEPKVNQAARRLELDRHLVIEGNQLSVERFDLAVERGDLPAQRRDLLAH